MTTDTGPILLFAFNMVMLVVNIFTWKSNQRDKNRERLGLSKTTILRLNDMMDREQAAYSREKNAQVELGRAKKLIAKLKENK